jgi:hypothetical protein
MKPMSEQGIQHVVTETRPCGCIGNGWPWMRHSCSEASALEAAWQESFQVWASKKTQETWDALGQAARRYYAHFS